MRKFDLLYEEIMSSMNFKNTIKRLAKPEIILLGDEIAGERFRNDAEEDEYFEKMFAEYYNVLKEWILGKVSEAEFMALPEDNQFDLVQGAINNYSEDMFGWDGM